MKARQPVRTYVGKRTFQTGRRTFRHSHLFPLYPSPPLLLFSCRLLYQDRSLHMHIDGSDSGATLSYCWSASIHRVSHGFDRSLTRQPTAKNAPAIGSFLRVELQVLTAAMPILACCSPSSGHFYIAGKLYSDKFPSRENSYLAYLRPAANSQAVRST